MHGKAYYRPMSAKKGEENIIVASWQQSNSFSCSKFQAYYHIQEVRTIRLIGYHKLMIASWSPSYLGQRVIISSPYNLPLPSVCANLLMSSSLSFRPVIMLLSFKGTQSIELRQLLAFL